MFHFFFNDTATTEIYTLSLHDALPISTGRERQSPGAPAWLLERARQERELAARSSVAHDFGFSDGRAASGISFERSEEHTSELQSRLHLVCRLLLEKKKQCELTDVARQ